MSTHTCRFASRTPWPKHQRSSPKSNPKKSWAFWTRHVRQCNVCLVCVCCPDYPMRLFRSDSGPPFSSVSVYFVAFFFFFWKPGGGSALCRSPPCTIQLHKIGSLTLLFLFLSSFYCGTTTASIQNGDQDSIMCLFRIPYLPRSRFHVLPTWWTNFLVVQ